MSSDVVLRGRPGSPRSSPARRVVAARLAPANGPSLLPRRPALARRRPGDRRRAACSPRALWLQGSRVEHLPRGRRPARRAGDEHQHGRRGARTRAGSPTASARDRDATTDPSAARIGSCRSPSTAGRSWRARVKGIQPGFRVSDPEGHLYQIKFDPRHRPEMPTGGRDDRDHVLSRLRLQRRRRVPGRVRPRPDRNRRGRGHQRRRGRERRLVQEGHRGRARPRPPGCPTAATGRSPAASSRARRSGSSATGARARTIPNDVVPHEHRRELRALRVFAPG